MLVLAADLEQVEEVCCRGVDGDEVFVWVGGRRGEGDYFEVVRALEGSVCAMGRRGVIEIGLYHIDIFFDLDPLHRGEVLEREAGGCLGG